MDLITPFSVVLVAVILQRLGELVVAARNARWMQALGGYEVGATHYKWIVLVHAGFFLSLFAETVGRGHWHATPYILPSALFLLAQLLRIWCLLSLGKFWNTRIYILPGSDPVVRGPYRFLRHPNYVTVALELLALPLAFGAWYTACTFTLLNAAVLRIRIAAEEQALAEATGYAETFASRSRFLPVKKR